jgi:acetyl esterase/lipase
MKKEQSFMKTRLWHLRMVFVALACFRGIASAAKGQEPEIRVERNIVYGKADRVELQLNLALPKNSKGPFPAVVCIHGGGWYQGQRQELDSMAELLARRGYVAATVSYRLVPTARFPAQIEDCKAAVRWLRANARTYHINPDRIGAIGFSAGAAAVIPSSPAASRPWSVSLAAPTSRRETCLSAGRPLALPLDDRARHTD